MADSIRLRIAAAVEAALNAESVTINSTVRTRPAGLSVHRFPRRSIQSDSLPVQIVYWQTDVPPNRRATNTLDMTLRVAIESHVKVPAGVPPDDAVDPLLSWAHHALYADETLGGIATHIELEGSGADHSEGEETIMQAITVYRVHYVTNDKDPESNT